MTMNKAKTLLASLLMAVGIFAAFAMALAVLHSDYGVAQSAGKSPNGFDVGYSIIPSDRIFGGGPARDGIPALTDPEFLAAGDADYMRPDDVVVGVKIGGEARAYPLRILVWHESVNDTVGGAPIAVSYCPLCRSALVFDRRVGGETREFGVSGLLWNSNVLLYDRQQDRGDESLWSQAHMKAVTGPAAREKLTLKLLPAELTSWREWLERNPDTVVMSKQTGHLRNYDVPPYESYFSNDRLIFPVDQMKIRPDRFKSKEPMIVVNVGERWKAYAVSDVAAAAGEEGFIEDAIGNERLRLEYSKQSRSVRAALIDDKGSATEVPAAYMFWFALSAMLPEAEVYEPPPT
jgi:hypothetical protein